MRCPFPASLFRPEVRTWRYDTRGNRAETSRTTLNLRRTGECVLNLPSVRQAAAVNRLALTTGRNPVPPTKAQRGYRSGGRIPGEYGKRGHGDSSDRRGRPPAERSAAPRRRPG